MAAVAAVSNATWNACAADEYIGVGLKAFFQGMQATQATTDAAGAMTTDCYSATSGLIEKFDKTAASFFVYDFTVDPFKPIYSIIESSNSLVDLFVMCETTNLAKQFSNRFTTWSGLLDFAGTIGTSFLKNYVY